MENVRKVVVKASAEYAILIGRGILGQLGEEVKKRIQPCKAAIITDTTVEKLYAEQAETSLQEAGFTTCRFVYPAGEASKHIGTLSDMLEFLAEEEVTRQDIIVALGGGVCGDMAGFAAAVYQRGIRFVQVPTTFLAAVDSSVGGKTAIDLKAGKNMAGAFYQPHLVLCDVDTLDTLPEEVFADGIAETLKYGVIGDAELFEKTATGSFRENLEEIIETCVKMKRDIVMEDEFDTGVRQLLNLGHTLGHAIEKRSGFTLSHGHAVAIGMHLIAKAAEEKGLAEKGLSEKIRMALENNRLPVSIDYSAEEIVEGVLKDKKRRGGEISFVFPTKIGHCEIVKIPVEEVTELVEKALK
ncbi:MAG: 3-dehydroquinate synthase [Anaerotignum sp.]|nr:3-dehydroquinate synthase [Anaerotignum sp.]